MAVIIDTFYSEQYLEGTRPSNPSFPVGVVDPVVNPPGTGGGGFSVVGTATDAYVVTSNNGIPTWEAVVGGEPIESNSLTVKFDNYNGYIHGNSGALSGNIFFDFTGEILGVTVFMLHNSATVPTFPAEAKIISGTYVVNIDNYIWFCITKKTTGRVVQVTIGKI